MKRKNSEEKFQAVFLAMMYQNTFTDFSGICLSVPAENLANNIYRITEW